MAEDDIYGSRGKYSTFTAIFSAHLNRSVSSRKTLPPSVGFNVAFMQAYGSLDSLLEYTAPPAEVAPQYLAQDVFRQIDPLETFLDNKLRSLTDILDDITNEIRRRVELSQHVQHLISQHYCYLRTNLFELYTWPLGSNRSADTRRIRLEQQLDTLNQEHRKELVNAFQDTAALKKEFRMWLKQYFDLVQRVRLLSPATTREALDGVPKAVQE